MPVDRRDSAAALTGGASFPSLRGRSVFITGGGSGIGGCLIEAFARQGALVAFVDYRGSRFAVARATGSKKTGTPRPVVSQVRRHRRRARCSPRSATPPGALGDFHVLVNNVASDDRHDFMDVTPEY